jgi:hypothetical protein
MEVLVCRAVDNLRVEGLLVLMVAVDSPINGLLAARGEADAVDVERVEFRGFGGQDAMQGNFSDLELVF